MASDLTRGDTLLAPHGVPDDAARDAALFITGHAVDVHGDDPAAQEWAREMLEAVGLIPTVPATRAWNVTTAQPRAASYGRCQACGRKKAVRVDGMIGGHRLHGDYPCSGEGLPPKGAGE